MLVFQKILKGYNFNYTHDHECNKDFIYTWTEYDNLCISKFVRNNDLFMIVWDTVNEMPINVKYGSIGVDSIAIHNSIVDATDDIVKKYNSWMDKERRNTQAQILINIRNLEFKVIGKHNGSIKALRKIYLSYGIERYKKCIQLLLSNPRNNTKKNLLSKLKTFILNANINLNTPFTYYEWQLLENLK